MSRAPRHQTAEWPAASRRPSRATAPGARPTVLGLPWAPNVITIVRTVAAMALATGAAATSSLGLLIVGYAVYWLGDMADGAVARWRDEKTRVGAVFDIVSDRACTTMLATAFVVQQPAMAVPLVLFLVQFCVVDSMLSLGFLYWPVDSPNDFHLVDRLLWRLNWSPPAKAVNTAAVVLLVWSGSAVIASAVAVGLTALKVWSLRRMVGLLDVAVPIQDVVDEPPTLDLKLLVDVPEIVDDGTISTLDHDAGLDTPGGVDLAGAVDARSTPGPG